MKQFYQKNTLQNDESGATVVEFAIVAPVFLIMMMGVLDLGYMAYMKASLVGSVQEAARDSTLETGPGSLDNIDDEVKNRLRIISPGLDPDDTDDINITRTSYFSFDDVGQPENFEDDNGDGLRDPGECFEDVNFNDTWDSDIGEDGIGGPNDIVLYTVTINYDRLFPFWALVGSTQSQTLTTSTVLKNQPYGDQIPLTIEKICT